MTEIYKEAIFSEELFNLSSFSEDKTIRVASGESDKDLALKEQAREEGYKTGFSQGIREGFKQGEEQAQQQNAQTLQQLTTLLQSLASSLYESRLALKEEIADIVLAICQQFFIQQQQSKEAIAQQITAALKHVNDKQNLTLALNPQDLALLQQGELKIDFSQCKELRVISDERLNLGGCQIRSEHGLFDAGIEGQIDRLKQVLLQLKGHRQHG
ncbi:Yop proteins translocation protein L [Legionella massiliensis]|uniref:Flagellar assembly protein FliH n=1 Tax=Legionella massiliensis TaxID=1034943 RepID=A0A078KZ69_9GAMM|nr:FliH/SctL family protein [Legionella massiliensis]CDZ77059.1 Yop proteins translocation protein L [Legionella massiliensis]CEE12797.1 Yop proteins translocation protein L [Legionella massiliensis]